MTSVVRLHLRSTLEHVNHRDIEEFCLGGYAGVGWGCWDDTPSGIDWSTYEQQKLRDDGRVSDSVRRLHDLPVGALVWTRREDSSYYLGELTGNWEYRGDQVARDLDLFNLRPCRWWPVGTEDAVPGKIVNNFRATVAVNPVADPNAVRYTCRLHAQKTGAVDTLDWLQPSQVIESMLDPEGLEDLVSVYLQDRRDLLLVARGRSTPGVEYVLRHRSTGRRAVASVKSGETPVDLALIPFDPDTDAYAYAVSGSYSSGPRSDVERIKTEELVEFVLARPEILPDQVSYWLARSS